MAVEEMVAGEEKHGGGGRTGCVDGPLPEQKTMALGPIDVVD